jgi:hypothetical protein
MKINKPTTSPLKKIGIVFVPLLVIVGCYTAYAYINKSWPFIQSSSQQSNGPTEAEKEAQQEQEAQDKQDFLDNDVDTQDPADTDNTQEPDKSTGSSSIDLKAKTDNDALVVTTNLSSISSGTCTLTLTKGADTITKKAEVIYSPDYSTCAGFSIDLAELGKGTWNISLTVKTDSGKTTKSIDYKV